MLKSASPSLTNALLAFKLPFSEEQLKHLRLVFASEHKLMQSEGFRHCLRAETRDQSYKTMLLFRISSILVCAAAAQAGLLQRATAPDLCHAQDLTIAHAGLQS